MSYAELTSKLQSCGLKTELEDPVEPEDEPDDEDEEDEDEEGELREFLKEVVGIREQCLGTFNEECANLNREQHGKDFQNTHRFI